MIGYSKLPNFAEQVKQALALTPLTHQDIVITTMKHIAEQKSQLVACIERFKTLQKDYDFSDYEARLLLLDEVIEQILETNIFYQLGNQTELGKQFYAYLETITPGLSEAGKGRMKRKLI